MDAKTLFRAQAETFGLTGTDPWAVDAIRLLFSTPRAYAPLVDAWDVRYPGTVAALKRLGAYGFACYQPGIIVDTRTGAPATHPTRKVPRYRTTVKGRTFLRDAREDPRLIEDTYPNHDRRNTLAILDLLGAFDLPDGHTDTGVSFGYAHSHTTLTEENAKWWLRRWQRDKYVTKLTRTLADVREVIPAHWRATRTLQRQFLTVAAAFNTYPGLAAEVRTGRSSFLADIDPARIGVSGATDFDHDVTSQTILAALLTSPRMPSGAAFNVEPRYLLPTDSGTPRQVTEGGSHLIYTPDADVRDLSASDQIRRNLLEYERFQSRRSAWNHIERFAGYMHTRALPGEPGILRFVVNTARRERGYVQLCEAFADYGLDFPERLPRNPLILAVSSLPRLIGSPDALADSAWFRVPIPAGGGHPVIHHVEHSPYNDYFAS